MRSELPGLTGLRGLLALAVLLYHCNWLPGGWLAVDGFFLLSGIVLTHVYGGRYGRECLVGNSVRFLMPGLGSFFWARLARLMPVYWLAVVASALVIPVPLSEVARAALIFPVLARPYAADPLVWSLAVEWCLYLMFPVLLALLPWLLRRRDLWLAVCTGGFAGLALLSLSYHEGGIVVGPLAVLRGLFPFVAGMILYGEWNERLATDQDGKQARYNRRLAWRCHTRRCGFLLHTWNAAFSWMALVEREVEARNARSPNTCVCGANPLDALARSAKAGLSLLDSRPIRWLGEVSLPLYLLQVIPLRLFGPGLPAIAAAVALAASVHYTVEDPARRWLRTMKKPARVAPAGSGG